MRFILADAVSKINLHLARLLKPSQVISVVVVGNAPVVEWPLLLFDYATQHWIP